MQKLWLTVLLALPLLILTSCAAGGPAATTDKSAADALTGYLQAMVDKNEEKLTSLVCPSWQSDALIEYDAFQAVETRLDGLSCQPSGKEGEAALVACQGKILAKYVDQTQEFDLSNRVYRLEKGASGWQVCGYTTR